MKSNATPTGSEYSLFQFIGVLTLIRRNLYHLGMKITEITMNPSDIYFVKLSENDNVVTITKDMKAGTVVDVGSVKIVLKQDIPFGHKFTVENIEKGGQIVKYGVKIGVATTDIEKGEHVHIHNVGEVSLEIREEVKKKTRGRL